MRTSPSARQRVRCAAIISIFLIAAAGTPVAHAVDVTTYGAGLKSCRAYLDAREKGYGDEVAFIDWLAGYFSGVNKTSNHRNNMLGLSDLKVAIYWLDEYCRARPLAHFAGAASMLVLGAKPGPAAHSLEVTTYGSADKACTVYLGAREQREVDYWTEFSDWLGGYLSGVNAISMRTNNILGNSQLTEAVYWLDSYCSAHPGTPFGAAVEALVAANEALVAANRRDK